MGLGCAALTQERSGLRGWLLGAAAMWVSAAAQSHHGPPAPTEDFLAAMAHFHRTLTLDRVLLHLVGAAVGGILGATSFHRRARRRAAGA
jgi:hypothetical protein